MLHRRIYFLIASCSRSENPTHCSHYHAEGASLWKPRINDKEMTIFICCCCWCFLHLPCTFYWNQNEALFLKIDKEAFVHSHRNVGDAFIAFSQTVENASIQRRDSIYIGFNGIKPDCQRLFPEVYGKGEEWSAHGTQQQDFLMECFDNVRAPSRLLCEVLLNNLSIVLYIINAISSSQSFADTPVIQNTFSLSACLTAVTPFLGEFTWLFIEVQWQLHRILIWLQYKSLGESTGSKQMAKGIWWIIVCLRGQFVICIRFRATPSFS